MKKDNINYVFGFLGLIFLLLIMYNMQTNSLSTKPKSQNVKPKDTTKVEMYVTPIDSSKFYKDSIQIIKKYTSDPNSAGGVDLNIVWKNKSKRTIKYVRFEVSAINAVDDEVYSEISVYDSPIYVKVTGPIKPNQVYGYDTYWECAWYNSTIRKCKIRSVELVYMDGSKIEFTL
jgi:hypothetical protein